MGKRREQFLIVLGLIFTIAVCIWISWAYESWRADFYAERVAERMEEKP